MKKNVREKFGNWGGISHLAGNVCLAFKVVLDKACAGQPMALSDISLTVSGSIFILGSLLLALQGHKNKAYAVAGMMAMAGYVALGIDIAGGHGANETYAGLAIGFMAAFYGTVQALKREAVASRIVTILLVPGETLTRALHKRLKLKKTDAGFLERFPFLSSGLIEFVSDSAIMAGAWKSNDVPLALIAGFWTAGSMLLMSALPRVARYTASKTDNGVTG